MINITLKVQANNIQCDLPKIYISPDLCINCGICAEVCPFGLPKQNTSKKKYEILQPERCTECSACKRNCPTMAIALQEKKGCGCLWNTRSQLKNKKRSNCSNNTNCCS